MRWNNKEEIERILWVWSLWDLMLLEFFSHTFHNIGNGRE